MLKIVPLLQSKLRALSNSLLVNFKGMMRVLWGQIQKEPLQFLILVVLAITLGVLAYKACLTRDEIRVRQRPFFGLTIPQVQFRDKDADVTKHEVVFTMNFENKGPVQANGIRINQTLFYVKKDLKIEKAESQIFRSYKVEDVSVLPKHVYPIQYMEHLKTLKDKLFKEYGEQTEPGFLLILTDINYHGIKEEPKYFQDTVYLFEWAPAYTKCGEFRLLQSKSN